MSWIDRINNITLKIVTGEGSEFTPLWKNASRSLNFNASKFDFNNIEGSLVRRGKVSSFQYPVELHFTGIDHIDEANRFVEASKDQRPWTIIHPLYGSALVQPASFSQNNALMNDSVFNIELFETIPDTFPDNLVNVQAQVLEAVDLAVQNLSVDFQKIGVPEPSLIATITSTVNQIGAELKAQANSAIDLAAVQTALSDTLNAIDTISSGPVTFMNRAAELARTPAKFFSSVQDRVNVIEESYANLKSAIVGVATVQTKQWFEAMGGALTAAKAEAVVTTSQEIADEQGIEVNNIVDYKTRPIVIQTADSVADGLDDYLDTLGAFQSVVDATPDSYTPSQKGVSAVKNAINKATGQLLQIAVNTKQERIYTVPKDTNLIVLVHRLLGNYESETIEDFVETNNILLSEYLQIPQGREIVYYL